MSTPMPRGFRRRDTRVLATAYLVSDLDLAMPQARAIVKVTD